MKKLVSIYSLAVLASVFLFGCKSSTEPSTDNTTTTTVHPGVGSRYTYHSTTKDSTGTVTDEHDYTLTVIDTNSAYAGRTGVISALDNSSGDTARYILESNGDVSIYEGDASTTMMPSMWMRIPFSGGAGMTTTIVDTTGDLLGIGLDVHLVMSVATSAAGSESVTAAGKTVSSKKAKVSLTTSMTVEGQTATSVDVQNMWFAPSIGNLVKIEQPSSKDISGETSDSKLDILTAYSLK